MDEHEDASVANSDDYVSSLRVSVDGGDETPIGKMDFEGRSGRVEGGESVVDEFGGAFHNAEDIMVEVMGSDVFVDGVCSSGGGGSSDEEEVEAEVGCGVSVETGSVREEKFGGGGVDDLVPREVGDLAGGSETESKGSLVVEQILDGQTQVFVTESRCTHTQVVQEEVEVLMNKEDLEGEVVEGREVVEGGGVVNDDTSLNRFGITDDEVLNPKNETGSKGSLVVEQILDGQTQVFVTESRCTHTQAVQEEVEVLMNKEDLEGREVIEGGGVVNDAMSLNKVGITDDEVLNKNETGVKESSQIVTTMHQETCDVLENVQNLANEKGMGGGLVQQGVGKLVKSADDVVSVLDEKMARESGALDNEVGKSETEAEIVSSTTIVVEFSSVENQVGEGLNPKHEVPNERDQISMTGKVAGKIQDAKCVEMESSYEQTQVVDNEVAEIHREEVVNPKLEVLKVDSLNENPACSDNNKNSQIKTPSKETVGNVVLADSEASDELIDRGEVAAVDVKEALNEVEVPQVNDLDENICCSEDQEVKTDMKSSVEGTQIVDSCDIAANTKNDVVNINNSNVILDASAKIVCANIESISMGKGDHDVGDAAGIGIETHLDVSKTDALEGNLSFKSNANSKVEIECGSTSEDGIDELARQSASVSAVGSHAALNCTSSHNEGHQDQGQVICNDNAVLDCDQKMDHHASDLAVSHDGENQAVKANHVGGEVQGLGETVGFPVSECLDNTTPCDVTELGSDVGEESEDNGHMINAEHKGLNGGGKVEAEERSTDAEQPKTIEEEKIARAGLKSASSVRAPQASYLLPTENEAEFSVSDLVWGKVRSHPWWPGQIFDPSESSEQAMKYHKKDCYLVAYFGDRTFAWNDASLLKHFRTHFSLIEKQSNSEAFHGAVNCALEEISRRVELGLACSCIEKDTYEKIKYQIVENTGIRQESSRRNGVDKSASANSFEPDKLVEYVKELARLPSGGADQLDLVIAKAQLLSLYRLKGYHDLPEFQYFGELVENDADIYFPEDENHSSKVTDHGKPKCENGEQLSTLEEKLKSQNSCPHKRKHNLKDRVYSRKKEKNLSELIGGTMDSPDDEYGCDGKITNELASASVGQKRRAEDSFDDDSLVQDKRKSMSSAHVSNTISPSPRQSFKIGECISRVASQLTGSPSIRKSNGEIFQKVDLSNRRAVGTGFDVSFQTPGESHGGKIVLPTDYSTTEEMLPQLHLVAQDPKKGYIFLNTIVNFFSDFRNSVIPGQYSRRGNKSVDQVGIGRKKKTSRSLIGSPETFEFEDMKDSYWRDRVIQNGSEEQPSRQNKRHYQLVAFEQEDPLQVNSRLYSRKKSNIGNHKLAGERTMSSVDERKPYLSPTELVMSFPQANSVPSETNLTKMFRRFGPLMESETEVDRETSQARVIFKRCSDAEVAFSSAGKFNIFGPMLVTYKLNYSPLLLFKVPSIAATQDLEAAIAQDMEMAATEYLEEATTQYLEDVSIQYLEDGTTQYLEDASTPYLEDASTQYLEDASMQYLEVGMTQNLEHARADNLEDASPHNLEGATTLYLQDAMAQNLSDAGTQNLEGAQSQNMGGAAEPNVEDVAAQNLDLPNLEGTTVHNVEDAMTQNVEGAIMQNVEGSTMQNLEVAETPTIEVAETQNLEDATTQNVDDETSYHMEDATAQHMEDATTQGMKDPTTNGMEEATTHGMEDAAANDMEDAMTQHLEDETAQHMEVETAQHDGNTLIQNMEDAAIQNMEDETS